MSTTQHSQYYTGYRLNPLSWDDFYKIVTTIWPEQAFVQEGQDITIFKHYIDGKSQQIKQLTEFENSFRTENLESVSILNAVSISSSPLLRFCKLTYGFNRSIDIVVSSSSENFLEEIIALIKKEFPEQRISSFANRSYVSLLRIDDLRELQLVNFDLKRLIKLCEEANICARESCWLALSALNRMILDHIPPLFGCKSFDEVANNYGGNRKQSFKKIMLELVAFKNISDRNLHSQIEKVETIPTVQQVDFSKHLDILLDEIIRIAS